MITEGFWLFLAVFEADLGGLLSWSNRFLALPFSAL
jgi:hypothetical protein